MSAAPSETRSENECAASATRTRLPQAAPTIALEAERATLTPAPMTVILASSDSRVLVGGALASVFGTRALCMSRTGGAVVAEARWMCTCARVAVAVKSKIRSDLALCTSTMVFAAENALFALQSGSRS